MDHLRHPEEYPAYFGNVEGLTLPVTCTGANVIDLREYPIFRDESEFKPNKQPGPDRVVIARISGTSASLFAQCILMTQDGAPTPKGFVKCEQDEGRLLIN